MNLDSLMTGENAAFIDQQYVLWKQDPSAVSAEWAELFGQWDEQHDSSHYQSQGSAPRTMFATTSHATSQPKAAEVDKSVHRQVQIAQLINAYRVRGHIEANIDPLGRRNVGNHPELTLAYHGLTAADLHQPVSGKGVFGVPDVTTLEHIIKRLRKSYCGGFGVEFMNINDPNKKRWLQSRIETLQDRDALSREEQMHMLRLLSDAENFEKFLHNRYPGTKRFSLEGAETLIPLLALLIDSTEKQGVKRVMLGMAHRGRLNVLVNILNKPVRYVVDEFDDEAHNSFEISGDVKYHLGYSSDYSTVNGNKVRITLGFNPSHLEAVNPVIEGRSRARQDRMGEGGERAIMPLLIHGDAAFAGQGVVAETLQMSRLNGYRTGGTVHVVINNQIGFTTSPSDARSTPYCSDVARMMAVPIFHVNGEDVEAVAEVVKLAAEWRQTYHEDVVIDMYCFRKWGHNEGDEPSFTQPTLYNAIRSHSSAREKYAQKMVDERGDLSEEDVNRISNDSLLRLEDHMKADISYDTYTGVGNTPQRQRWSNYNSGSLFDKVDTTIAKDKLVALLEKLNTIPDELRVHRKVSRLMKRRLDIIQGKYPVDWAVAEQAAYASLVNDGYRVRLSGQDCGRGTFSHRHAVLMNIETGEDYVPLANIHEKQGTFEVFNSHLSEYAVLGFEHGYTLDWPDGLVIWEAQFGDFANGAQIMIDNFIMASEQKWGRTSGLVMLLPHGYEGQGPEHSSARIERFLQMCAEENAIVANCTTPANLFHLLRRQVLQAVRKPLVIMSPKSLLRHPKCISTMDELATGEFFPVYYDADADPTTVKRVVFCSGKIYYQLLEAREQNKSEKVALIRLERLYPFPEQEVQQVLQRYPDAEIVWCQEEPRNMGAWPMMDEWLGGSLGGRPPRYIGRKAAASPATGSPKVHREEQSQITEEVFRF